MTISEFENTVLHELSLLELCPQSLSDDFFIGAAVSGGADSLSLLLSLVSIYTSHKIKVITVNHNIRSSSETLGDALYVKTLCDSLGVYCKIVEIERGVIAQYAQTQCNGIEDAARVLRYEAFDDFIHEEKIKALCIAHNQNDQLETVVMRFLQGSGIESSSGIKAKRDYFVRPLLNISRRQIEDYLVQKKCKWRTDSTNIDNNYLRNKIRNILIPQLDFIYPGWKNAVLSASQKNADDNLELGAIASSFKLIKRQHDVLIDKEKFLGISRSIKRRVLYRAINLYGYGERFPFALINQICDWNPYSNNRLRYDRILICNDEKYLYIKEYKKDINEYGFIGIIKGDTEVLLDNGKLRSKITDNRIVIYNDLLTVSLLCKSRVPVVVRSYQKGDRIKTCSGTYKSVGDIYSDWHVPQNKKSSIPLVVIDEIDGKKIIAVLGCFYGYKNWILEDYKL